MQCFYLSFLWVVGVLQCVGWGTLRLVLVYVLLVVGGSVSSSERYHVSDDHMVTASCPRRGPFGDGGLFLALTLLSHDLHRICYYWLVLFPSSHSLTLAFPWCLYLSFLRPVLSFCFVLLCFSSFLFRPIRYLFLISFGLFVYL